MLVSLSKKLSLRMPPVGYVPVTKGGAAVTVRRAAARLEGIATAETILRDDELVSALPLVALAKVCLASSVTVSRRGAAVEASVSMKCCHLRGTSTYQNPL